LLEKEKAAEEEAAVKQRRALHRQQEEEAEAILSSPTPLAATAFPRRRGPTPLIPTSTVNEWGTDMGMGANVRILYVDTRRRAARRELMVRSTKTIRCSGGPGSGWLRDEASNDVAVVLLPPGGDR
jgi:hypothetical protein